MNAVAREVQSTSGSTSGQLHREAMLNLLRDATAALESDDRGSFDRLLETIAGLRQMRLADGVARLARRVQNALHQIDMDSRLACIAGREIPDARTHLDFVVRMTEDAAHRTLDLVDVSRAQIDESRLALQELKAQLPPGLTDGLEDSFLRMRSTLVDLAQAQEYQDLSGQMIRRVIKLVQEIETALTALLDVCGIDLKTEAHKPIVREAGAGIGPRPESASSQQDADDLLADLGL